MDEISRGIEYTEVKGVNIRNAVITIVCTGSIVCSVCMSYFGLKGDISDIRKDQTTSDRIVDVRIRALEVQISLLQSRVEDMEKLDKMK